MTKKDKCPENRSGKWIGSLCYYWRGSLCVLLKGKPCPLKKEEERLPDAPGWEAWMDDD